MVWGWNECFIFPEHRCYIWRLTISMPRYFSLVYIPNERFFSGTTCWEPRMDLYSDMSDDKVSGFWVYNCGYSKPDTVGTTEHPVESTKEFLYPEVDKFNQFAAWLMLEEVPIKCESWGFTYLDDWLHTSRLSGHSEASYDDTKPFPCLYGSKSCDAGHCECSCSSTSRGSPKGASEIPKPRIRKERRAHQ